MKKVLKLLYIEHNPTDQEILKETLKSTPDYQFSISIASTGSEGVEMLKKETFDMVMIDYKLPGMDGIQILKKMEEENIDTPVIMVTGTGNEHVAVNAMKAGAYDYVVKDISYKDSLPIVITRALEKHQGIKEREQLRKALEGKVNELELAAAAAAAAEVEKKRATELELAYSELRKTQTKLVQAEKLATIGTLASILAHELRNPFGIIKTTVYNLGRCIKDIDPRIERHLDIIDTKIDVCNKIITDLLSYSSIREPERRLGRIDEIIEGSISSVIKRCKKQDIQIEREFQEDLPEISVDKEQIDEVFINLLDNACGAMPSGGKLCITVKANREENFLTISIADTGCGIPKENMEKLGKPFFSGKSKGIGLGLAVVYQIIESHHGKVSVDSQVGKETIFTIKLPIRLTKAD